jgi:hypothetical protein
LIATISLLVWPRFKTNLTNSHTSSWFFMHDLFITLMMETVCTSETLIYFNRTTQPYTLEGCYLHINVKYVSIAELKKKWIMTFLWVTICILASCGGTTSMHSLFSVTTTHKENSVFSATCFDLLKSLSSAVCHTINMSLIVYNCRKPLLWYHVLLLAIDNKNI